MESIVIRGAREHNLKNIDVVVPRNKFVVITGVSGSGKSSLAFDTIFAEGQRRYVESLSAYARQFLEQREKHESRRDRRAFAAFLEHARTRAIRDRTSEVRRSTLPRLLYALLVVPHCTNCARISLRRQADGDRCCGFPRDEVHAAERFAEEGETAALCRWEGRLHPRRRHGEMVELFRSANVDKRRKT